MFCSRASAHPWRAGGKVNLFNSVPFDQSYLAWLSDQFSGRFRCGDSLPIDALSGGVTLGKVAGTKNLNIAEPVKSSARLQCHLHSIVILYISLIRTSI